MGKKNVVCSGTVCIDFQQVTAMSLVEEIQMVVALEKGTVSEVDHLVNIININLKNTNSLLDNITVRLEKQVTLQAEVIQDQHSLMEQQDKAIEALRCKLLALEEDIVLPTHF